MTNSARSLIRTVTPIAAGFLVSLLAHIGVKNPAAVSAIGSVSATAYYAGVRVLEHKYPKAGVLLGAVGAPSYPAK